MRRTKKVEVEVLKPGVCAGSIETIVDRNLKGWGMSAVGFGGLLKEGGFNYAKKEKRTVSQKD